MGNNRDVFSAQMLIFDTSAACFKLSMYKNGQTYSSNYWVNNKHEHDILDHINEFLQANDTVLSELSCLGCSKGPGSFTGVRVGCAIAQGLSAGLKIPIIYYSSLLTIAASYFSKHKNALTVVAVRQLTAQVLSAEQYNRGIFLPVYSICVPITHKFQENIVISDNISSLTLQEGNLEDLYPYLLNQIDAQDLANTIIQTLTLA